MEKKVGFKLHKVKKNWVTIELVRCRWLYLRVGDSWDQSAQADEVSLPNGDGFEQTDAGIESSASLTRKLFANLDGRCWAICQWCHLTMAVKQAQATSLHHLSQQEAHHRL